MTLEFLEEGLAAAIARLLQPWIEKNAMHITSSNQVEVQKVFLESLPFKAAVSLIEKKTKKDPHIWWAVKKGASNCISNNRCVHCPFNPSYFNDYTSKAPPLWHVLIDCLMSIIVLHLDSPHSRML